MDTSKTAPGPGATENFPGVFLIVDKGEVEIGADKQDFREYFFNGQTLKGRIIFRRLDRQTSEKVEKHLGGVAVCGAKIEKGGPGSGRYPAGSGGNEGGGNATSSEGRVAGAASRWKPEGQYEFPKLIEGPSGAKLKSYVWPNELELYIDDQGEERKRRISDWTASESSHETGREIVHQFTVEMPDGTQKTVSAESAVKLLGYGGQGTSPARGAISTAKTFANLKMREAQLKQLDDDFAKDYKEVHALPTPPVISEPSDIKEMSKFKMGDSVVYQHGEGSTPSDERKRALETNWRSNRLREKGWQGEFQGSQIGAELNDVQRRAAKAESKLKELGEKSNKEPVVKAETLPVESGAPEQAEGSYWLMSQPEDQTPYVISPGAVESGWLPPVGISALPKSVKDKVPEGLTFWSNADNKSREEKRKELMEHLNVGDATATTKKLSKRFAIVKSDDAKMVVTGIVYEPDVVDGQGDYADADAIEKAAYDFMEDGWLSLMHERKLGNDEARLVESYVAPVAFKLGDTPVRKGTWIQSWKLSKTLWDKVKGGEYTGFSLEGDGGE